MVCAWYPGRLKLTLNSLDETATEHGVLHVCPCDVRASAPAGSDSNCIVVAAGAGFGTSNCMKSGMAEQAARLIPQAAMTKMRFMAMTVRSGDPNGRFD